MTFVRNSFIVANIVLVIVGVFFSYHTEVPCLLTRCTSSTVACILNEDCRNAVICQGSCGSNMNCTYACLASYENDIFKHFVQCGISDEQCIIPEVDPNQPECNVPAVDRLSKEFALSKLVGKWYIVYGLNPIYDCFNGQWSKYEEKDNETLFLTEFYDVIALNGSTRTMRVREDLGYVDASVSKSVLYLRSNEPGVYRDDEFRILAADPTWSRYILVYYCGMCANIRYEGAIVYSRDPVLREDSLPDLKDDMKRHGWTFDQFCPVLHYP